MCGRYTAKTTNPQVLQQTFDLVSAPAELVPRYNVAPTQPVAAVVEDKDGRVLEFMRWGLIPSWSKDPSIASKLINARAETIAEKPTFRTAFKRRRCLIVADGFYEWQKQADGSKIPMYISLQDDELFGLAGLWERWTEPDSGEILTTCTIITTQPNELMASIHNRMPVILPRDAYEEWLDPQFDDAGKLQSLLVPYDAKAMQAYPVSSRVNNPRNEGAELLERLPGAK